jgi:hypothetical protein
MSLEKIKVPQKYQEIIKKQEEIEKEKTGKFPGFPPGPAENYWQYPKALNGWWHILSGSEQKVLDYILRHTWGYGRDRDAISVTQFEKGIYSEKEKRWIDKGTGLSRRQIFTALKGLIKKGFIELVGRGKRGVGIYKLRIKQ